VGRRQAHVDQSLHVVSGPLGAAIVMEGNSRSLPHFMGKSFRRGGTRRHLWTGTSQTWSHRRHWRRWLQYAKGHKYLTLVYQIDLDVTRLLWVGKERTIESFQGFFTTIGDEVASKIVFVCSTCGSPI